MVSLSVLDAALSDHSIYMGLECLSLKHFHRVFRGADARSKRPSL